MSQYKILLLIIIGMFSIYGSKAQNGVYDITNFGAKNDGKTLCTEAIQKTIDKCAENGGGKVVVPPGKFLSGALFLKSNICFEVMAGATLLFDDNIENTPIIDGRWEGIERKVYASIFTGHHLSNVSIIGRGTIDGQGEKWWNAHVETKKIRKQHGIHKVREPENPEGCPLKVPRPRLVNLYNCTNVLISELTFINSPSWTIHPVYCENITIEKISIIQPYESPNTDGIDPESCKDVRILNCFIDCGDDCITIKSGYNEDGRRVGIPCENVVISNCTFAHGRSAIGIGSEMSGGVKNVSISNCVFNGTLRGLRIKTNRERGGTVENYRASNIVMSNVETAISVDMYYGNKNSKPVPVSEKTPTFKNMHLSNITATDVKNSVQIIGLPESPVDEFSIVNSSFKAENGFKIAFVNNLSLRDVSLTCSKDEIPLKINDATEILIDDFKMDHLTEGMPVINLNNVNEVLIRNCNVKQGTQQFVKAIDSDKIELMNNLLKGAKISK
ncbi:glycoside hydrolase family 28 protein [Marinifilum caeruleilacunae]|uniref:Glycoside hydrolase family 28 protein n=1 Tax=Marinifilum caeruleilacunae TaxID=2499076 RepID=A0ABX1WYX3_9BACT|nr:glycoside hydrolase family 28 protein [Marinifilum caeruleilacunae]NOU61297.1 glycoside hydrolase family 28 protein [Marinifilum caeruleilacunae]